MRVGVNALLLGGRAGYRQSGISRYLDRLIAALPAALGNDEVIVYTSRDAARRLPAGARARPAPLPVERAEARIAWEQSGLPAMARRDRLDLFHGPVNVLPRLIRGPAVVTIHDLAFLRWPEQVPSRRYRYLANGVRDAARRATRIITVSEATRRDVIDLLGADPTRVAVTHLGVEERFHPAAAAALAAFRARRAIDEPYILAVGNLEPRKNLPRLLQAFARIAAEAPHRLVLAGAEGWLTGEFHDTLAALKLGERVRLTGFVPDDELPLWYAGADLFVFPSLYEGFGLPVIEAMACGTPVVTANVSSLPEVAGGAAALVDPLDVEAIAAGMARVLGDAALATTMRDNGMARARSFTWAATAARTAEIYREAVG